MTVGERTTRASRSAEAPGLPPGFELVAPVGDTAWGRALIVRLPRREGRLLLTFLAPGRGSFGVFRLAVACAGLSHPALVPVSWAGRSPDGSLLLLTDLGEGRSLMERLESGRRFAEAEAVRVVREVARALDHLSRRGLGHGALSPHAVTLSAGGRVRLRGFGPDRSLWAVPEPYRPPEAALGESPDGAADVYALGRILRAMLAGDPRGEAPLPEGVTAATRELVSRSLEPLPAGRLRGPAAFAARCARRE